MKEEPGPREGHRVRIIGNQDIKSVTVGIPAGHLHMRGAVQVGEEILCFQEATLAAIVRGYIQVKTHPYCRAVRLKGAEARDAKPGYARWQLTEDDAPGAEEYLACLLDKKPEA
jgi:hypothetical protein